MAMFVNTGWFYETMSDMVCGEAHERSEIDWSVDSVINSVVARAETITSQKLSFPGANESAGERQNMRGWGLWLR